MQLRHDFRKPHHHPSHHRRSADLRLGLVYRDNCGGAHAIVSGTASDTAFVGAATTGAAVFWNNSATVHHLHTGARPISGGLRGDCAPVHKFGGFHLCYGRHSQCNVHRQHGAERTGLLRQRDCLEPNNPRVQRVLLQLGLRQPHGQPIGYRRAPELRRWIVHGNDGCRPDAGFSGAAAPAAVGGFAAAAGYSSASTTGAAVFWNNSKTVH
jgi:hypothetical protein